MNNIDKLAKALVDSTEIKEKKKTSPYYTSAKVVKVEGDTAWVSIEGGVEQTPARMVVNARAGEDVRVHVAGGNAYVTGNATSPPTDDSYAKKAEAQALRATKAADHAVSEAETAHRAADGAVKDASLAHTAAANAANDANTARQSAKQAVIDAGTAAQAATEAEASASEAATSASNAETSASEAATSASSASASASIAQESASAAQEDADDAKLSATTAITQLGIVEDVVGVLKLLSTNAVYAVTNDEEPIPDKWYFTQSVEGGTPAYYLVTTITADYFLTDDVSVVDGKDYYTRSNTEPYTYTLVDDPVDEDIDTYYELTDSPHKHGYYEIVSIDEAVQDYLTSRIAVTASGMWIQDPNMQTRILLSPTDGIELYGVDGVPVAKYGETAMIGRQDGFHIEIDGEELGFYQTANVKVAYVRNNQLFIPQSVVLDQMDIGLPFGSVNPSTGETTYGQWSWKLHLNAESPRRNNLTLKWIG